MRKTPVFAVLGAGSGGQAIAGLLALTGAAVRIWNRSPQKLAALAENNGIMLRGVAAGLAPLSCISADMGEVVRGADIIMIVVPATAHRGLGEALAPLLSPGQTIVLNPGRTGGAFEVMRAISASRPTDGIVVAEAQTLLVASRLTGPGKCRIFSIKKSVGVAALPCDRSFQTAEALNTALPYFYPASNVLETSLDNMGMVLHPGVTLLNSARIESAQEEFDYYHQGVTPSVARVISEIDQERVLVSERFGVPTRTARQWLNEAYGANGESLFDAISNNEGYVGIKAPRDLDTRYIWEDVPMSLVPLSELGRIANIKTPTIDGTIALCSALHGIDYRAAGRNAGRMGIEGLTPEEVLEYAKTGSTRWEEAAGGR